MEQNPPRRVDPDLLEAFQEALLLFGQCVAQNLPRHTVDQTLEGLLSDNTPLSERLTERQRLLVWKVSQRILDAAYTESE